MTIEKAIELLDCGTVAPDAPQAKELADACRMACDALRARLASCSAAGKGTYCCYVMVPGYDISCDKCLASEIRMLNDMGIRTIGCCCGHGTDTGYIQVDPRYIGDMKRIGYVEREPDVHGNGRWCFVPKSVLLADCADKSIDGIQMERLKELAAADKAGRLVILPDVSCTDADGEEALRRAMWKCGNTNNGVTRFTADAIAEKLCREAQKVRMSVKTPLGEIVAEAGGGSEYPGIWVSLHKPGEEYEPTLAMVEYTATEADYEKPAIITRVWADTKQDEYTDRVIHTGLEKETRDEH